jgi:predicted outer membrane repeat protein
VKPDGTGDFPTIQAAIDAAEDDDLIILADGTYTGNGNRDIDFRGKAIRIRSLSLDPDSCIIDCQGGFGEPHHGFVFHSGERPESVLEGVTIRNGIAWGVAPVGHGGALSCDGSSPTLIDCVFFGNFGSARGGGAIYCTDSSPTFLNCRFIFNFCYGSESAGGAMWCDNSDPTFVGCVFAGNRAANGGALMLSNSNATITNCTFLGNSAASAGPFPRAGAIALVAASPRIRNCTFYWNWRGTGGAIMCSNSSEPTLEATVIAFSYGAAMGPLSCIHDSNALLTCCDIYGNEGGDWIGCIEEQLGTNGNISADPLFCDPENGDFHLRPESPCQPDSSECGLIGAWPVGCE